jgi:hypothetical protein
MAGPSREKLILAFDHTIEGQAFKKGAVLGELRDGNIIATAAGLTRGHLEARLRRRVIVTESQMAAAAKAEAQAQAAKKAAKSQDAAKAGSKGSPPADKSNAGPAGNPAAPPAKQ